MKKMLVAVFCLLSLSSKSLACGMSLFGSPLLSLLMPELLLENAVDQVKEGAQQAGKNVKKMQEDFHRLKAKLRKNPEYVHLERELEQYLVCAAQKHRRCEDICDAHDSIAQPVFLHLHRQQDRQAWSALVYELLTKKIDRFAELGRQQTVKLPASFQMTLEKVNMLRMLESHERMEGIEFKHLFAAYDYRFWIPRREDRQLKTEFRNFAQEAFHQVQGDE